MRFVLVNGRTPNPQSCLRDVRSAVRGNYLRDIGTQFAYCSHDCYADQCKCAVVLIESQSRAS